MNKYLQPKNFLVLVFSIFAFSNNYAQTELERAKITSIYDLEKSRQLTEYFKVLNEERKQRIENYLAGLNEEELRLINQNTIRDVLPDGTVLHYVNDNQTSAQTIRADRLHTGGSLGLDLNGQNMIAGLWEAENSYPLGTHLDLTGRITIIDGGSNVNFHATHVAGTIISSGDNITLNFGRGIAYQASLLAATSVNDDSEMNTQAANGLLVSNHSYGFGADGLPETKFGAYDINAYAVDQITSTHPFYVPVISAGNDRNSNPAINPSKGGYDLLTGQSIAKNGITSAAVQQVLNYTGPSDVVMSSFSNYGPTDDGRIKPDISSKGVGVLSTSNASDTAYGNSQGTSMSAPAITGLLLLLQQHYNVVNSQYMLAATAKGLLLHTADEAGLFPGPDYGFGWGLANGEKAAQTITNNGIDSYISEVKLDDSQTNTLNIEATGSEPLMVSISWTDAADISTIDETIVDNRVPDLINDLDLKLSKDGTDYYPWKLDYNFPSSPATRNSTNDVDNFEKVEIDAPTAGEIYSVTISHKGTLQGGSQNYSFIVTGGTLQNLSVDDNSLSEFFMWPNPTNDVLNFRFNSMNSSRASVDLIDIQGRNVYSEMLNNSGSKINSTIDVSNLNQGLYILRIKQGNALMNKKVLLR